MDGHQSADPMQADNAYSPQVINDQDTAMGGQEEVQNPQNGMQATTSPPPAQTQEQDSRYNSPSMYQQPTSRPNSGMGGMQPQQYQESNRQAQPNKSSVVIKVGMVGDAQIGKTSLMVKYVEGNWDEDYIQTLGKCSVSLASKPFLVLTTLPRCELHGENNQYPQYRDHIFNLGSWRSTRIRKYAPTRLQRRRRNPLHVRPHPKIDAQQHKRVVPSRSRLQ